MKDPDLVEHVGHSELIVLPYREMHYSGAVLVSLSLNRPVLVPRNAANEALDAEVGPGWIQMFSGDLTGRDILDALGAVRAGEREAQPDLHLRDWDRAGRDHVAAYRRAAKGREADRQRDHWPPQVVRIDSAGHQRDHHGATSGQHVGPVTPGPSRLPPLPHGWPRLTGRPRHYLRGNPVPHPPQ